MTFKLKRPFLITLIALLLLFAAKAYYDTNSVEIRHYQIKNSTLGEVLNGLKAAHLTDLHIKNISERERKVLEILKDEKPDIIFITGDYINFIGPYDSVISFFQSLQAPLGVYAVLGNADYSNRNGSCILCHQEGSKNLKEKTNPIFLRNSATTLKINGKALNIIGVDDPVDKKSNLKTAFKNTNSKNPSILLAHSPEIFEEASGLDIDLLLCGHTHGGQIFFTKYLRKIFPLEASLEFIEGFFQKGKMLMYVSRGLGVSYLPFRFGIKPEITFFTFSNNPKNPINSLQISNHPSTTIFTGLSLNRFLETFNIFNTLGISSNLNNSTPSNILFDFESESDLKRLNWECYKWFELSKENVTSGKYSLKVVLPPGPYPGIDFQKIKEDWSEFSCLKMDIFNPATEEVNFHIRIDDSKSGVEYANRFDIDINLKPKMNHLFVPIDSIRTNLHHRSLNLKKIERLIVFVPNNLQKKELYLDHIRLE